MNLRLKGRIWAVAAMSGLVLCAGSALGQYAGPAVGAGSGVSSPAPVLPMQYQAAKIMPGDVISIYTYGAPELSTTQSTLVSMPGSVNSAPVQGVKLGAHGEIVLPYLGVVKLAGLTAPEAADYLAKELKDKGVLVDPQVSVEIVASPTRVITVVGEVARPQPIDAFGHIRLLDVISDCGGLTPLASHTITVRRVGDPRPITVLLGTDPKTTDATNIPLMAGDTVLVSRVGDVFVVGQVKNPQAIPLGGNSPITVLRAISMSGGVNYGAALSKVTIIRTTANDQRVKIRLDLKKIMNGKEQDVALVSDDILLVPTNGFKAGMAKAGSGVAAGATDGIVYALK